MTTRRCPSCDTESDGRFCPECGAAMGGVFCTQCGAEVQAGARFCTQCGAPVGEGQEAPGPGGPPTADGAGKGVGGSNAAWWIAGGLAVVLAVVVAVPMIQDRGGDGPPEGTGPAAGASPVDLDSMTPREAADRLYNRVMGAAEAGDTAQVAQFLPMTIQAYDMARPLNADGLFHLALVHQLGGDDRMALETAEEALGVFPDHLLNLAAAARAADALGDEETAREHYRRLLDVWDAEMAKELPEYDAHGNMMPDLRAEAEAYLGG